ncbi:MAG: phosphoribosylglycinamide formyltransferase [Deltaproteobacteria bacterium]|jgi:phosphoribosylglycinamide formyltransferase-1|nr:phosphoribosylglycinamide formyltransferase [Deltaproteobacteria bacterium]
MRVAILCSGRGSNLLALLRASEANLLEPAELRIVLTDSAAAGAINIAREWGLYAAVVPRSAYHANRDGYERRLLEVLAPHEIELVVLAGYKRILGPVFLEAFPNRIINIHPALLPSFRGQDVWPQEVASGIKLAGATVHFVEQGVDSGPIIIQGAVPVLDDDGPDELAERILRVEHQILPQALAWLASGRLSIENGRVRLEKTDSLESAAAQTLIWPPLNI